MQVKVPVKFEKFLRYTNIGIVEEAIVSIRKDTIDSDVKNNESTIVIYTSMKSDVGKNIELPDSNIKDKSGNITGQEPRKDIGLTNISLFIKSLGALNPSGDFIDSELTEESWTLLEENSKYRILLCHPDVIKVPGKIKSLTYNIQFELIPQRISQLLRGMSIIEDSNCSIEQKDGECNLKIGIDITNNYIEKISNQIKEPKDMLKYFNKDHIQAILTEHKSRNVLFQVMDKILRINTEDLENGISCDYYLSPKTDVSIKQKDDE